MHVEHMTQETAAQNLAADFSLRPPRASLPSPTTSELDRGEEDFVRESLAKFAGSGQRLGAALNVVPPVSAREAAAAAAAARAAGSATVSGPEPE